MTFFPNTALHRSLCCALLALPLATAASAALVADGLVHLWHLDEPKGATTAVDSIGSWNLQAVEGAAFGVATIDGTGVTLDGVNDYLMGVPIIPEFLTSNFTLSLWLRWLKMPGKPGLLEFAPSHGIRLMAIDLAYRDPVPSLETSTGIGFASSRTLGDKAWHLLTVVREGNSASMYLDADLVGSDVGDWPAGDVETTFRLGVYGGTHLFGGLIDEVAIYDRALSASEVAANAVPEPNVAILLVAGSRLILGARYPRLSSGEARQFEK